MMKHTQRTKEEVAEVINSLLIAHKFSLTSGMPITQLNKEYREQDGTSIPFREFGYTCLMDFLISLQRTKKIVIGKRGLVHIVFPCIDSKIAHVSALVSKQKNPSRRPGRGGKPPTTFRSFPRLAAPRPLKLDSQTLTDVLKHIRTAPNGVPIDRIMEYLRDRNILDIDRENLRSQLLDVRHEVFVEYDTVYPITKNQQSPQPISNQKITNSMNGHTSEFKSAATVRPAGDSDSDHETFEHVRVASKVEYTEKPPPKSVEKESEVHERSAAVAPPVDENANVPHHEDENSNLSTEDDVGMLVNSRTRFRLDKLIQQHPEGIWCAELPAIYQKAYSIPLNYEDLGFGSVSDFAAHLPEIFYCVRLQDKGDFKLFNAKAPKPLTKESARPGRLSLAALHNIYQSYYDENEAVPVTLSPSTTQRLVPDGVMTIGETVAQIYVTELFPNVEDYVEVVVVDVFTPTFFWIHVLKKTTRFRRFMMELHEFYFANASKYVIPIVLLEKGLNCACIYDEKWHRAVIKSVKADNSVTVMFYDYGTVMTYPPENIHFLHRTFSGLPAQAIPCGLYNVKPKSSEKWSYAVCKEFVAKVLDVPLVAMLGSIDVDNNSMLIALTNTEGVTDLHINDWMVSAGYAIYGKMGDTVDMNETREESLVATEASAGGAVASDLKDASLIATLLGLDPPIGRPPGLSKDLHTILEEPDDIHNSADSNLSPSQSGQISPQLANYLIQQAKMILAMESVIQTAVANGFKLDTTFAGNVGTAQSDVQRKLAQNGDSKDLESILANLSIGGQTPQQGATSEPPLIPHRPYHANPSEATVSHGVEYETNMSRINGNVYPQNYANANPSLENYDTRTNFDRNPFNHPAYTAASTIPLQFYQSAYDFFLTNGESRLETLAAQTPANFSHQNENPPPATLRDSQFGAPASLPAQTFEISLEQSAKSFFERVEAPVSHNRVTNPFKLDVEDEHCETSSPSRGSTKNPFVSESEALQCDEISSARVQHNAAPVSDLSGSDSAREVRNGAVPRAQTTQETLDALKQYNVEYWLGRSCSSNANCINGRRSVDVVPEAKAGDHSCSTELPSYGANSGSPGNTRTNNLPPPLPPRPSTNSKIESEASSTPATMYGLEWTHATENAISFKFKGSLTQTAGNCNEKATKDVSDGDPATIKVGADAANKPVATGKAATVKREVEELRPVAGSWDFREVQLTKQMVYLIHLDNEGWLTIEELLTAFTSYKCPKVVLKILEIQNAHVPFRFIKRTDYPKLFEELERTSLAVPRDYRNRIGDSLHLVPIKSILKVLRKLKIIDLKEVELATKKKVFSKNSSALFDACTLITIYANLQQGPKLS